MHCQCMLIGPSITCWLANGRVLQQNYAFRKQPFTCYEFACNNSRVHTYGVITGAANEKGLGLQVSHNKVFSH